MIDRFSLTLCLIANYLLFSAIFAICAAIYLFFAAFNVQSFIITGAFLLSCFLIFGVVALLKCLSVAIHKLCKAEKSTQIRNQISIGLSGILIFTILPRIFVFFVDRVTWFHLSGPLSCVISVALYVSFVFECDKHYDWESNTSDKPYWIMGVLYTLLLIVTVTIAMTSDSDEKTIRTIVLFQFFYTMFGFFPASDLYGVLAGLRRLEIKDKQEERAENAKNVRLESVKVVPKIEEVPRIECKICLLEFNEMQTIPRILIQCGHTVCQSCIGKLLRQNNGQLVFCPYCQKPTLVDGSATLLPKNFALLDAIEGKKN